MEAACDADAEHGCAVAAKQDGCYQWGDLCGTGESVWQGGPLWLWKGGHFDSGPLGWSPHEALVLRPGRGRAAVPFGGRRAGAQCAECEEEEEGAVSPRASLCRVASWMPVSPRLTLAGLKAGW